jgi:hypothetical protein
MTPQKEKNIISQKNVKLIQYFFFMFQNGNFSKTILSNSIFIQMDFWARQQRLAFGQFDLGICRDFVIPLVAEMAEEY